MFDSISNIFSLPTVSRNKYKDQPSLRSFLKKKKKLSSYKECFEDPHFNNLIQCFRNPIQDWILQQEENLKTFRAHQTIFHLVIQNSKKNQQKEFQENKLSVHNLFVLMVQYDVLLGFIKEMEMSDLQLLVDGACGIILKNPHDSMEELTCLLHHIFTKFLTKKMQKGVKELPCIYRPLQSSNIQNFIKVYGELPKILNKTFHDSVVRVIPMIVELLKVISQTDQSEQRSMIIKKIPWIQDIPSKLLYLLCTDIDQILEHKENNTPLSSISYDNDENPDLRKKLIEQGEKIIDCEDAGRLLFMFAIRQLYYFQHVLRLQKFMMRLIRGDDILEEQQQRIALNFIEKYLKATIVFQVIIPENHFKYVEEIFKLAKFQRKSQLKHLIPEFESQPFQQSIKNLQACQKYQWRSQGSQDTCDTLQQHSFTLHQDQNILTFLLKKVYSFQLNYLHILILLFKKINHHFLQSLQFYLIKNGLLHFLIQEQHSIQGHQKEGIELFFTIVGHMVKQNTVAFCILDEILKSEIQKDEKSVFNDSIRKYFCYAKHFLMVGLSDTVRTNIRNQELGYFLPYSLQLLLYPEGKNQSKHDIWISYIHDVIVRDLKKSSQRLELAKHPDSSIGQDIHQWITISILIQIEYVMCRRGKDLELGEFTMNYMTNILKEAIKWQYEDQTSVMKRILFNYEDWDGYYTDAILNAENNEDVIEKMLGPSVNFLFLKRWNKKIINSINIFIESVLTTQVSEITLDQIKKLR